MTGRVAIDGLIGSGKSTTASLLAMRRKVAFVGEQAQINPFLAKFYLEPSVFAFETELCFLLIHYHQLVHIPQSEYVSDFTLGKDLIFASMNLRGDDLKVFECLYRELCGRLQMHETTVYLSVSPETCLNRIRSRGIASEGKISIEYLTRLHIAYQNGIHLLGTRVEIVAVDERDSPEVVADKVESALSI